MGRLRIALVTPELPNREYPNRGGAVYQTMRHLCESADVQAFCPLPRYPSRLRPRRFDYRECDLSYSLEGLPTCYFEYPAVPFVSRPLNGLTCARFLEPLIRSFRPDVILNFVLYPAGFAAVAVGQKLRTPVVVGSIGSDLNAIPDPISGWLTRRTLRGASRIIAKSEQLRTQAIGRGGDPRKIHIVANGCDSSLFAVGDRSGARCELGVSLTAEVVVFVGRMHRRKGVYELLEAAELLSHTRPELSVIYVGDGPESEGLKAKASLTKVANRVRFAGTCSADTVAKWLIASDLFALPSYAEGCPNAVIEALSCGRPVIACRVGALEDMVDESCGRLVPPADVASLRDGLDAALGKEWDEKAIARRFRRTWKQVAEEILAICQASQEDMRAESGCETFAA